MSLAMIISQPGGPEVLKAVERELVSPGPDEVSIRQEIIGVNFVDIYFRSRALPSAPIPRRFLVLKGPESSQQRAVTSGPLQQETALPIREIRWALMLNVAIYLPAALSGSRMVWTLVQPVVRCFGALPRICYSTK